MGDVGVVPSVEEPAKHNGWREKCYLYRGTHHCSGLPKVGHALLSLATRAGWMLETVANSCVHCALVEAAKKKTKQIGRTAPDLRLHPA